MQAATVIMDPQILCRKRPRSVSDFDGSPHGWAADALHVPRSVPYPNFFVEPDGALPLFNYTYHPTQTPLQYCDTEPLVKRRRTGFTEASLAPYYPRFVSHLPGPSDGLCSFHQHYSNCFNPLQGAEMPIMGLDNFSFTKRMVELGLFLCPCCSVDVQQGEGYLRLTGAQAMSSPDQPYLPEKAPISPFSEYEGTAFTQQSVSPVSQTESPDARHPHGDLAASSQCRSDGSIPSPANGFGGAHSSSFTADFSSWKQPQATFTQQLSNADDQRDAKYYSAHSFSSIVHHPQANSAELGHDSAHLPFQVVYEVASSHRHSNSNTRQQGKRGPFRDASLREDTAYTRKIGCCIRCRMQRIRCDKNPEDPDGVCLTCKKVNNVRTGRLPCLRLKIADVRLYKPGQVPGYEWTQRWTNGDTDPIQTWFSTEIKIITISEGYSDNPLSLRVRKFVPQEGDKLDRSWVYQGQKKSVGVPPYALIDLHEAKIAYENYINKAIATAIHKVVGAPKGLLCRTYKQIASLSRRKDLSVEATALLQSALRLWMSARLTTKSSFIVGDETLGMRSDILDETSPTPGKVPLPPVLGAQLDMVLIQDIQKRLRKDILDKLQRIIQKNKHCNWLAIYLAIFILLHNASLVIAHDAGYARKHGMDRRFARENMVKEYHLGANILLAHFHYCNKGTYPLSEECTESELNDLAKLTDDDKSFIHYSRQYAKWRETEWKSLRESDAYDDPYFYICQLFEQEWQPRNMS